VVRLSFRLPLRPPPRVLPCHAYRRHRFSSFCARLL